MESVRKRRKQRNIHTNANQQRVAEYEKTLQFKLGNNGKAVKESPHFLQTQRKQRRGKPKDLLWPAEKGRITALKSTQLVSHFPCPYISTDPSL